MSLDPVWDLYFDYLINIQKALFYQHSRFSVHKHRKSALRTKNHLALAWDAKKEAARICGVT